MLGHTVLYSTLQAGVTQCQCLERNLRKKQILIDLLVHINVKRVHEIEENGTVVKLVYTVGDNAEPKRNHCFAPSINK